MPMWLAYIIIGTAVVGTEAVGIAVVRQFNAGIITNRGMLITISRRYLV